MITCRSTSLIWQIGKCFLWGRSCWFHQQNLILRTCSQGTYSCTYTSFPFAEENLPLLSSTRSLTGKMQKRQKSHQHCSSVSRPTPFKQQPGIRKKKPKRSKGSNSAAIQGGSLISASPVKIDKREFELVWSWKT